MITTRYEYIRSMVIVSGFSASIRTDVDPGSKIRQINMQCCSTSVQVLLENNMWCMSLCTDCLIYLGVSFSFHMLCLQLLLSWGSYPTSGETAAPITLECSPSLPRDIKIGPKHSKYPLSRVFSTKMYHRQIVKKCVHIDHNAIAGIDPRKRKYMHKQIDCGIADIGRR